MRPYRIETPRQTHARLIGVLAAAELRVLEGTYAYKEAPIGTLVTLNANALAHVRDDEVWSWLEPSSEPSIQLLRVVRFRFAAGIDNSGFVGWLASHLKARIGTGVVVICGQNTRQGGIFDYWGFPAGVADKVLAEIETLRSERSLDGVRMSVVSQAAVGVVDGSTVLHFTQQGSVVSAHDSGGAIVFGSLVGIRTGSKIEFRYAQVDETWRVDGGRSDCELVTLEDGRLRLTENFQWESRAGSGTNIFEEIPAS